MAEPVSKMVAGSAWERPQADSTRYSHSCTYCVPVSVDSWRDVRMCVVASCMRACMSARAHLCLCAAPTSTLTTGLGVV